MQWQANGSASTHEQIAEAQLYYVLREQRPLPEVQQGACFSQVAQHLCDDHDCEANPEEDEEAPEIGIAGLRIEV